MNSTTLTRTEAPNMRQRHKVGAAKHSIAALLVFVMYAVSAAAADVPATPEAAMQVYYEWMLDNIEAVEADLPAITAAAEAAAQRYVTGDWKIAGAGDYGVLAEACGRSGGIQALKWGYPPNYLKRKAEEKYIVFFALREDHYNEYSKNTKKILGGENVFLVAMGPQALIDRARNDGMPIDVSFAVNSAEHEGLFQIGEDQRLVPTTPVANMAALWAWTAEFVAACTRHGKMPVMFESYAVPGAKERAEKLKGEQFYEKSVEPVEAGVLGRQYLKRLRSDLETFFTSEKDNLVKTVNSAWNAEQSGHELYTFVHGHSIIMEQVNYPNTPGYFTKLNKNWFEQNDRITLEKGDFILCIGYSSLFSGGRYGTWTEDARAAGATLAWSLTDYDKEDVAAIREAGELFINQHWEYGDAVVEVPGFPFQICPTSGHIAQAVLRLVNAGLLAKEHGADEEAGSQARIGSAGHYITGGTLLYLLNEDGEDFSITLHRYNWPFEGSWNRRDIRVQVTDPDGTSVLDKTVETDEDGVTLDVPGGTPGSYKVDVDERFTLNYWHLETSLPRAVAWTGPGTGVAYRDQPWFMATPMVPRTWYFYVPEGTKTFTLKAQSCVARSQREDHGLIVRSPRGQPMAALWDQPNPTVVDGEIVAGREPPRLQQTHIVVEPGSDGRFWSLEVRLGGGHTYSDINLALEGVPPYLAHSPETWFNPKTDAPPKRILYDEDPFIRSDVPPEDQRERPYFHYWLPCPAVGDPDGNEIRTPSRLAVWNPDNRELAWTLRTYVARHAEAIKAGKKEAETATVKISDADGKVLSTEKATFHPKKHFKKTLQFQGVRYIDVEDAEHFWTYTYPATPVVLSGTPIGKGWHRFHLESGSLRHWFFKVPKGCSTFEVRIDALFDADVLSVEINSPDRRVAKLYGKQGTRRIKVPSGTDNRIWHLRVDVGDASEYGPKPGRARFPTIAFDLDLHGIPPYLAPTWEQWFNPRQVTSSDGEK